MQHHIDLALIKTALTKKASDIAGLKLYERIYLGSTAAFVLLAIANVLLPSARLIISTGVIVAAHGFVVGFLLWVWPPAKAKWDTTTGLVAKVIMHALAILIATACARYQVSMAMGLPAQDFELTVGLIALLLYLPALALLLSLLLAPGMVFGMGSLLFHCLRRAPLQERRMLAGFAHFFGALGLSIYAGQLFNWSLQDRPSLHASVRVVAALADYQPAENYPGIAKGLRVRLHENGVVSAVEIDNDGVRVRVWKLD